MIKDLGAKVLWTGLTVCMWAPHVPIDYLGIVGAVIMTVGAVIRWLDR